MPVHWDSFTGDKPILVPNHGPLAVKHFVVLFHIDTT